MDLLLSFDSDDPSVQSREIRNPQWPDVEQEIARLDGFRFTEVALSDGDARGLLVAGGNENRFVCLRFDVDDHFTLLNSDQSTDQPVAILRNGAADYPASMVVGIEQVMAAFRHFHDRQALDPAQRWHSQV